MPQRQPIIINDFVEVDFDCSLKQQPCYKECIKSGLERYQRGLPKETNPAAFISQLKALYNKNKPSTQPIHNVPYQHKPTIPFIIHQIWFGNKLPELYKIWQKKLKRMHPGWEIINWTEAKIKRAFPKGLHNQTTFNKAKSIKNYAKMADIARYEILNKFGGLYLDYDVSCFKSFERLHYTYNFYAGLESFDTTCYCCNAVIGSQPNHPIIKKCIAFIKQNEKKEPDTQHWNHNKDFEHEICKTIISTGSKLFTEAIIDAIDFQGFCDIVFPQEYFYPDKQTSASLCYHAAHSSWYDRLQESLDEKSLLPNTVTL